MSWSAARACRLILSSAAGLLAAGLPAAAAGPAPARASAPASSSRPAVDPLPPSPPPQAEVDPASRSVAARARTNECGHQWNNMKRSGSAAGTTWKEFFRVCQAQK